MLSVAFPHYCFDLTLKGPRGYQPIMHLHPAQQLQQQQLASLLAAAFPTSSVDNSLAPSDDTSRVAALSSLHRALLYPHNVLLLHPSSSFMCQALLQLLSDKSLAVRQAAATTFGAFCAAGSSHTSINGHPNLSLTGGPADIFLGWALPELSDYNMNDETAILALSGLLEFLNVGETTAIQCYVPSIVRTCQALLENEGTSLNLLCPLLDIFRKIATRFSEIFEPHFVDLVDLLLGWALLPDLSESDYSLITESFVQFQKFWTGNLPFSLSLLSKLLGDIEVFAQDSSAGTVDQLQRRLLPLASCFVAILQAMASGVLEIGLVDEINEPLKDLLRRLLPCLIVIGHKFRTYEWMREMFKCLSCFANLLKEGFFEYYISTIDLLFHTTGQENLLEHLHVGSIIQFALSACSSFLTSDQIHMLLKVNLQLIGLQGSSVLPSAVRKLLQPCSFFTCLRLHPSCKVTGLVSATYLHFLQHDSIQVRDEAVDCLTKELEHLKLCLFEIYTKGKITKNSVLFQSDETAEQSLRLSYSEREYAMLVKFDLSLLTSSVCIGVKKTSPLCASLTAACKLCKVMDIKERILQKLNPFEDPVQCCPDIQLAVVKTLHRLCCINIEGGHTANSDGNCLSKIYQEMEVERLLKEKGSTYTIMQWVDSCSSIIAKSLHACSCLPVKLEGLDWLSDLCKMIIDRSNIFFNDLARLSSIKGSTSPSKLVMQRACINKNILSSLLLAASDREQKVRSRVALVLGMLFEAELIDASHYLAVASIALEQLGDSEPAVQSMSQNLLALVGPAALWISGLSCSTLDWRSQILANSLTSGRRHMHWMQVLGIRQFSPCIRSHHLVCILNFLSLRTQNLPLNWLQRLVQNFPGCLKSASSRTIGEWLSPFQGPGPSKASKEFSLGIQPDIDINMLERICTTNNLASAWWAIHEAARHCITMRLRTHLGGPTQTFAALERMLLDIVHSLQTDSGHMEAGTGACMSCIQLLPMRLLLEFVDALKKNIYNAYEGSVVLSAPPNPSIHFFRANRKVCEEWFARIGEALMNASLALQCHAGTSQHALSHLQYLRGIAASVLRETSWSQGSDNSSLKIKLQQDILKTLRYASYAFCRMHDPNAITGLQVWALSIFGPLLVEDGKVNALAGPLGWMSGLALQAQGQYEKAAAHFSHFLHSEEALSVLGADEIQFIIARIVDSYVALADWESLDCWLQELHALRTRHAGKDYAGALTTAGIDMNAIHALARFDNGDLQGAWGFLDLTPQNNSDLTADPRQALQRSEQMLLQALLRRDNMEDELVAKEIETAKTMLDEVLLVSGIDKLSDAASYVVQLHCIKIFEAKWHSVPEKGDIKNGSSSCSIGSLQSLFSFPLDALHQDCLLWLKLLRVYKVVLPEAYVTIELQQQLVRLARKQSNFKLAHRMLNSALLSKFPSMVSEDKTGDNFTEIEYERILLLYAEEEHELALRKLWNVVADLISSLPLPASCETKSFLKAKACLKLSSWLRRQQSSYNLTDFFSIINLESKVDGTNGSSSPVDRNNNVWSSSTNIEELIGTVVKSATLLCPDMAKAWFSYACWCYDHAKAFLSGNSAFERQSISPGLLEQEVNTTSTLSEKEVEEIYKIISEMMLDNEENHEEGTEMIMKDNGRLSEVVAQRIIYLMHVAAGAVGDGGSPAAPLSLQLQQELHALLPTSGSSHTAAFVNSLMEIWWQFRKGRVTLYGCAVQGFLKYLSFSSWRSQEKIQYEEFSARVNRGREDFSLRSSLYVLHILLNYGMELEDVIQKGLPSVSLRPWQEITAQLFARLTSHSESIVRKQLEGLLMTLANYSPWAIVYPTLVDLNASEGKPSEELQRILGCLVNRHPKLVNDVKLLIGELGAMTVLWEEQWLSTLQDLHADVTRRIATLKDEAARVAENSTLSPVEKSRINAAKYSAMMAPIVVALERRLASTSRQPESPHETWFQHQYAPQLKTAISLFKAPPTSIASIGEVWRPFDAIATSLATHQKKSLVQLYDVAPRLALLVSSDVPMPGLEKQFLATVSNVGNIPGEKLTLPEVVTVAGFDDQVFILATKTKPKKLSMLGSDSQRYTYLLKGREDLRLDARIMQLLQAVNGMIKSRRSTRGSDLAARYYSVTPISGQAGLIQWVDNLTSIYGVYKTWQQRNQAAQTAADAGASKTNTSAAPSVPRPSDMFYGKIIPALKEKGLRKVVSRKDWPQEVKRKVLLDLMKETPRQLLYREIWCASEGFVAFSSKQHRFSGSVAVMSMVGHILGLGDRHLDNILMDLSTGDVVHIDYNVCFDKGLRLKIPEIVPFRLTQTIQAALGPTGIEGAFRAECEAVLEVLRRNKHVILMLLEVFVWDPLVEWMRGDGHDEAMIGGEERKGMELAVSLSLFASRFQEIRVPLQEHHDQLLATLPTLTFALQDLLEALEQYESFRVIMLYAEQEKHNARRAEVTTWSMMNEIITTVEKGEFQMSIASMRDHTIEAAAAISAFSKAVKSHSALTTEAGSMLEEVLLITEGAEAANDVRNMAKLASTEHNKLITDLNKVNTLLFPLEAILTSAVNVIRGELSVNEGEQNMDIAADHNQAVLKLLLSKIRELTPMLFNIVPGLLNSVKNLHACLAKLARTASLDAGVLHKALEGVGESQELRSQDATLVLSQLPQEPLQTADNAYEQLKDSHTGSPSDEQLMFQDDEDCWISAPSNSLQSSSDTQVQYSFEGSWLQSEVSQKLVNNWTLCLASGTTEKHHLEGATLDSSARGIHDDKLEGASPLQAQSQGDSTLLKGGKEFSGVSRDYISGASTPTFSTKGESSQKHDLLQGCSRGNVLTNQSIPRASSFSTMLNTSSGVDRQQTGENLSLSRQQQLIHSKDKNAYAISVLKRVELKLEGRDVDAKRQLSVADQVDHLLRQAINIDNLSNMYEGWTPWI